MPEYTAKHVYTIECMVGSQLISKMTARNGQKGFDLTSLSLPKEGEVENAEQKRGERDH